MLSEIHAVIDGKVQGVFYRAFAEKSAKDLNLVGFVKNLPDNTVEVVAQGLPENLKAFVERLHEGSVTARVENVSVTWRDPTSVFEEFCVRF